MEYGGRHKEVGAWFRRALLQAECKAMPCPYPMRAVKGRTQPLVPVSSCPLVPYFFTT
jgi:hypothetical protein